MASAGRNCLALFRMPCAPARPTKLRAKPTRPASSPVRAPIFALANGKVATQTLVKPDGKDGTAPEAATQQAVHKAKVR